MFYSKWGGSAVLDGRGAQLWLRYDANTKPVIRLKSPEMSDLVSDESIRIAAENTQTLHAAATLPNDTELKSVRICVYVTNGFKSEKLIDTGSKGAGL